MMLLPHPGKQREMPTVALPPYRSYVLEGFNFNGVNEAQSLARDGTRNYSGNTSNTVGAL